MAIIITTGLDCLRCRAWEEYWIKWKHRKAKEKFKYITSRIARERNKHSSQDQGIWKFVLIKIGWRITWEEINRNWLNQKWARNCKIWKPECDIRPWGQTKRTNLWQWNKIDLASKVNCNLPAKNWTKREDDWWLQAFWIKATIDLWLNLDSWTKITKSFLRERRILQTQVWWIGKRWSVRERVTLTWSWHNKDWAVRIDRETE